MKKELRKCAVCGKKFTPKAANALYCSEKCYKIAKAKRGKARKEAVSGSLDDAKKIASKPVAKKQAKKVVKAVCKEKIELPKKEVKGVVIKKVSPPMMLAIAIVEFIKFLKEIQK